MRRLFAFQGIRMRNNRTLFLLPILLIIIGISGIFLGNLFGGSAATPKTRLLSLYNAYLQFTFLFLLYVFVSTFAKDFSNGTYTYMKQIGYSMTKCLVSKSVILVLCSFFVIDIFMIISSFVFHNTDFEFLVLMLFSINLAIIFIIFFAMVLSLTIRKTMPATLTGYGMFILLNIVNLVGYGITNPADGNSLSYTTFSALSGQTISHYSLSKVTIDYEKYRYILTTVPAFFWICILLIVVVLLLKRKSMR